MSEQTTLFSRIGGWFRKSNRSDNGESGGDLPLHEPDEAWLVVAEVVQGHVREARICELANLLHPGLWVVAECERVLDVLGAHRLRDRKSVV